MVVYGRRRNENKKQKKTFLNYFNFIHEMLRQAKFTIFVQYTTLHTYRGNIIIKSNRKVSMSADFNQVESSRVN